jgi:hypothetical protein
MRARRVPALVAAGGTLIAGVALDRWWPGTTSACVSLALLVVAGLFLAAHVWLEARSLPAACQTVSMVTELAPPVMRMS